MGKCMTVSLEEQTKRILERLVADREEAYQEVATGKSKGRIEFDGSVTIGDRSSYTHYSVNGGVIHGGW